MKVHFISGLGADERVFEYLSLPGIERIYIKWIPPRSGEAISQYARRLLPQIDTERDVILIGMSFGGLVAQEMARFISCKKVILVSSVKSEQEYDWKLNMIRYTKLYKLIPTYMIKKISLIVGGYYFGVQGKNEATLLREIIDQTDSYFLEWAIGQIMTWKNNTSHTHLVQVHGACDRIFPPYRIAGATLIPHTGHFMVINKSKELSSYLMEQVEGDSY
jgi:pimeloyl-ACP methyl ester carboxylesterase